MKLWLFGLGRCLLLLPVAVAGVQLLLYLPQWQDGYWLWEPSWHHCRGSLSMEAELPLSLLSLLWLLLGPWLLMLLGLALVPGRRSLFNGLMLAFGLAVVWLGAQQPDTCLQLPGYLLLASTGLLLGFAGNHLLLRAAARGVPVTAWGLGLGLTLLIWLALAFSLILQPQDEPIPIRGRQTLAERQVDDAIMKRTDFGQWFSLLRIRQEEGWYCPAH